jgi:hypothetical protein
MRAEEQDGRTVYDLLPSLQRASARTACVSGMLSLTALVVFTLGGLRVLSLMVAGPVCAVLVCAALLYDSSFERRHRSLVSAVKERLALTGEEDLGLLVHMLNGPPCRSLEVTVYGRLEAILRLPEESDFADYTRADIDRMHDLLLSVEKLMQAKRRRSLMLWHAHGRIKAMEIFGDSRAVAPLERIVHSRYGRADQRKVQEAAGQALEAIRARLDDTGDVLLRASGGSDSPERLLRASGSAGDSPGDNLVRSVEG